MWSEIDPIQGTLQQELLVHKSASSHMCVYIYMGQCPAKSPLWYFFKISRTSKRKVTLALKCMANYKFSA